ncbi:MAG: hypothetical protein R2738_07595 [Bacteroides graminisolvens]
MLYRIHQIEAYFVVRAKKNLLYKSVKWKRRLPKNVLSDMSIELTGFYRSNTHQTSGWFVIGMKNKNEFVFLTNAMDISALQVAELYKNRWAGGVVLQMAQATPQN